MPEPETHRSTVAPSLVMFVDRVLSLEIGFTSSWCPIRGLSGGFREFILNVCLHCKELLGSLSETLGDSNKLCLEISR